MKNKICTNLYRGKLGISFIQRKMLRSIKSLESLEGGKMATNTQTPRVLVTVPMQNVPGEHGIVFMC